MKRQLFRLAEWLLSRIQERVRAALSWIDLHYPDPGDDELIAQIRQMHAILRLHAAHTRRCHPPRDY